MSITTYSELQTAIANWLDRTDLTARIPEFITLAESRLNKELRVRQMETAATDTMSSGTITLPTGWQGFKSIWYTSGGSRYEVIPTTVQEYNRFDAGGTDMPSKYYISGSTVTFYPEPDSNYSVSYIYYLSIPALTTSNTTNWLLTAAPDIYLYGALLEAAPYLKNNQETPVWAGSYSAAVDGLVSADIRDKMSGGAAQMRAY